jgi:tRNA G37 N-methylase Trm5
MDAVTDFIISHWAVVVQAVSTASLLLILWVYLPIFWGAPWIPGSFRMIRRMLDLAGIQPGQTVVDLGAGDGRIVILAAWKYGAKAVGVEIDPFRWMIANLAIRLLGLRGRADVRLGDLRRFPVDGADVVTLFLMQGTNRKLRDRLEGSLRPGARVLSHAYSMSGWAPTAIDERHAIFAYEIGKTGEDTDTKIYS